MDKDLKASDWFRPAVCYLVENRKMTRKKVAEIFGVRREVVEDAVKRHQETGQFKNRKGQGRILFLSSLRLRLGRKRTSTDEAKIEAVKEHLQQNNHTKKRNGVSGNSTRKLGKKIGIPKDAAHRILPKDLKLFAWKKQKGQKLNERQKRQRLLRARL